MSNDNQKMKNDLKSVLELAIIIILVSTFTDFFKSVNVLLLVEIGFSRPI